MDHDHETNKRKNKNDKPNTFFYTQSKSKKGDETWETAMVPNGEAPLMRASKWISMRNSILEKPQRV